jgi:membrane dipeptidase
MPGPDLDLTGEMKWSGLFAICMTFATDYERGDAYHRFLKGLAFMDRQLKGNDVKRFFNVDDEDQRIRRSPGGKFGFS